MPHTLIHKTTSRLALAGIVVTSLLATGCVPHDDYNKDKAAQNGNLTRVFDMVDKDGRHYGTVEMDPVSGGKVFDNNGRLIGYIEKPDRD